MHKIQINDAVFSTYWEDSLNGVDYIVVKGVPLVEGVLNSRYVPKDEFGKFVQDWNGMPIVLRHPGGDGSARKPSPDVPVLGNFYNAKLDGSRLVGEFWIDKNKLMASEDGEALFTKIKNQHPVEISTGYYAASVSEKGKWNDKDYHLIDTEIHPDHIALLPDEIGACSVADGCGLNRNQAHLHNSWEVSQNHYGPGPHKSGSPQSVHGGGPGAKKDRTAKKSQGLPTSLSGKAKDYFPNFDYRGDAPWATYVRYRKDLPKQRSQVLDVYKHKDKSGYSARIMGGYSGSLNTWGRSDKYDNPQDAIDDVIGKVEKEGFLDLEDVAPYIYPNVKLNGEESLDKRAQRIRTAFNDYMSKPQPGQPVREGKPYPEVPQDYWVLEIFPEYLVTEGSGGIPYRVGYKDFGPTFSVVFEERTSWKPVTVEYVTNELRTHGGKGSGNFGHKGRPGKVGGSAPGDGDENNAKFTKDELKSAVDRAIEIASDPTDPTPMMVFEEKGKLNYFDTDTYIRLKDLSFDTVNPIVAVYSTGRLEWRDKSAKVLYDNVRIRTHRKFHEITANKNIQDIDLSPEVAEGFATLLVMAAE